MLDRNETSLDYDRLCSALDRRGIEAFAQYRAILIGGQPDKVAHLAAVGELARRYALLYYRDGDILEKKYRTAVCEAAGILHESLEQGCRFEDLVGAADESVARVVAGLTADVRLPGPKRMLLLSNQVGLGSVDVQIVKLADLRHDCTVHARFAESEPVRVRDWLEEATAVASSFHKCAESSLASRIKSLKLDLRELDAKTKSFRRRMRPLAG